jgi:fructose-specific phosphotransferase system component IIB
VVKVEGTIEELRRLFLASAEKELKETAKRAGKKVVKETTKRALNAWQKFLRDFTWRKKKKTESNAEYMGLRSKAASRAWHKKNGTKKGQVRKTARRAYER